MEETVDIIEETQKPPKGIVLKWGLTAAIIYIVYRLIMHISLGALSDLSPWNMLVYLLTFLTCTILAQREFKISNPNIEITYGKTFGIAALVGLIGGILVGVYMLIHYLMVLSLNDVSDIVEAAIEKQIEALDKLGLDIDEEKIYAQREKTINSMHYSKLVSNCIGGVFTTSLFGLITSIIFRRK